MKPADFRTFEQKLSIDADNIINRFWTPNSEESKVLAADLKEHINRLREKIDASEVELKIEQVSDEIGQLQSDLMIAEASEDEDAIDQIKDMITERQVELSTLKEDLTRRKTDVINPRTLAFKTDPLFKTMKKDIEAYELNMSDYEILITELKDLEMYLKATRTRLQQAITPTVRAADMHGNSVPVSIIGDIAEYINPDHMDGSPGIGLYEYIKNYQPGGKVDKYAFFKKIKK